MIAPAHVEHHVLCDLLPRLVDLAITREDQPGHDQRLCARAALGKAAIDKDLIGAKLGHALVPSKSDRAGIASPGRTKVPPAGTVPDPSWVRFGLSQWLCIWSQRLLPI
ncbi:hypothetical protein MGWOODY_Smn2452 [hydrothermal vent metagenome]|uniref:Uncharacterized protein n=1 Tax=hydrothermal vent metagenome TaxID=652676 RepID=A0A160TKM7_9ZZZZ